MGRLLTILLPIGAVCGAACIVLTRPERAIREADTAKAVPHELKVAVPSIAERELTDVLSAESLAQKTPLPDLKALAAARKSVLEDSDVRTQLSTLSNELKKLKSKLDEISKQESSAAEQLKKAQDKIQTGNSEIADCETKLRWKRFLYNRSLRELDDKTEGKTSIYRNLKEAEARRGEILQKNGDPATQRKIIERNQEMLDSNEYIAFNGKNVDWRGPLSKDKRKQVEAELKRAQGILDELRELEEKIKWNSDKIKKLPDAEKAANGVDELKAEIDSLEKKQAAAKKTVEDATLDSERHQKSIDDAYRSKQLLLSEIRTREEAISKLKEKASDPHKPAVK